MNGYIKKWPMIVLIAAGVLFTLFVIIKYTQFAFTELPPAMAKAEEPHRGSIIDRTGDKVLAYSSTYYNFGITPQAIKNVEKFARIIAPEIGENENTVLSHIKANASRSFVYIKKKINDDTYNSLRSLCRSNGFLGAVNFEKVHGRVYPENTLASQLIGFVGNDGNGLAGIEYSMQDYLSPTNTDGELINSEKKIYLTIDANLQYELEKVASEAMEKTQAANIMLIAAEAKTGEILSYVSLPSANLNEYSYSTEEEKKNRPVTDSYEPGSVFKIFTVASFLDTGAITKDDIFMCDGIYEKRTNTGERIRITCLDHHGWETARDALKYSCNDALAQMSDKIESEVFLNKLRAFGFGSKTGIELPGETSGLVRNTSDRLWSARSKPTIAIGQEITVSAIQMVQAATAIANGGVPVKLTFIKKIVDRDGNEEYTHYPELKQRVLKESTANYVLSCMETVAQTGTGIRAKIGDVSIGVKTGTAQMADPVNGGYSSTDFLSNCIAVFPVEDPKIILYIVIQKAQGETYAGRIVAPVINQAANVIIDNLGMSRKNAASLAHSGVIEIAGDTPIEIKNKVPNFKGMAKRQILPLMNRTDINIKVNGDGWVKDQQPPAGTPLSENMEIELYLE